MIEFKSNYKKCCKYKKLKYPDVLNYEAYFSIVISGKVFFEEPNFPLLEFLYYVNQWVETQNKSLEYISIETEDNPLIVFKYNNGKYLISSPWQNFKCVDEFTKEEIISALKKMST